MSHDLLVCLQHTLSPEQIVELHTLTGGAKLLYLSEEHPDLFKDLANSPDENGEMLDLMYRFVQMAKDKKYSNILFPIGSPAMMGRIMFSFGAELEPDEDRTFIYAHTDRVNEDQVQPDGSVRKISVFRHKRFSLF
jgi:hypothetical protein